MKTPTLDKFRKIENSFWELETELREFLEKRGWQYTSDTPGCIWMMVKKIPDGRTIICTPSLAQAFEEKLCEEEYDEDDE
jgi:hypothetical protein